jgi:diguanylate cyclase (GGDEF)-like protein
VEKCVGLCAIAIEREETQSRIRRLAYFDALTGLPNREEFSRRALQALSALDASGMANLLHIGLDDFKGVNDALGHRIGDQLLQAVARRFAAGLGDDAFIARIGGDEFAVLDTRPTGDPSLLATELIAILADPFEIGVHRIGIGASIGIAQARMGTLLAELARRADMAMVEAKAEGRSSWCRFEAGMELAIQSRRALKLDLRDAVDARAFTLVYQPIVVLQSNALAAVEVLVRWHHPQRGHVSPAVFIPIVEEMGLIGALGDWVLREACQAAASWPRDIKVCVNLSPLQFRKPGFVLDVISALREADLAPERLHLEVTESALLARDIATRTALNELHDLGVRLSLDDFGTGYSSLQSLRSFPFDRIKIDMSFVRDIGIDADSAAIIRSVIALARDLGMESTAEGVENAFQYEWLSLHGCSEGQGYWFGRPMDGAELQRLLERPERDEELIIPGLGQPADV